MFIFLILFVIINFFICLCIIIFLIVNIIIQEIFFFFVNFYRSFYGPGLIAHLWNLWPRACLASLQDHCLSMYHLVPRKQLKLLIQLHLWQFTQDSTVQWQLELLVQLHIWQLPPRFNCPIALAASSTF